MDNSIYVKMKKQFHESSGELKRIKNDFDSLDNEIEGNTESLHNLEKAQIFLQNVAKETQEQLKFHINDIVNLALSTCFPNEYEFSVDFQIKRGKTEASLSFIKNGNVVDPMEASGGGVVDLASFALRVSAWSISKTRNTIILDEPFRFLSKDLIPYAGEILKKLSKHLKLQIIMVTHIKEIIDTSDKVFEVIQNKNGVSKVIEGGKNANE
jgi:DNA repair exonuclease SbcCD ATPase subunit